MSYFSAACNRTIEHGCKQVTFFAVPARAFLHALECNLRHIQHDTPRKIRPELAKLDHYTV
jgi:hypothetical protein